MSDRADKALEIIARVSERNVADLKPEMDLTVDLGIDSPKALELLIEIEDHVGVMISDEAAAELNTVGDVLTYVDEASATPAA